MKATEKKKKDRTEERQKTQVKEDSVKEQVFARLGRPKNLDRTTVTFCKEGCHARINIWCTIPIPKKTGFAAVENSIFDSRTAMTDTFYLQLSRDGGINVSAPRIQKKY
jgi:hypothetical protein